MGGGEVKHHVLLTMVFAGSRFKIRQQSDLSDHIPEVWVDSTKAKRIIPNAPTRKRGNGQLVTDWAVMVRSRNIIYANILLCN
jgi:hypothetical protein